MAVELDFDLAVAAGQITCCATGEGLDEVADIAFGAELGG